MLHDVDGWSAKKAFLMSAPPHAFALVFSLFSAWLSDRARMRAPFLAAQTCLTSIGLLMRALSPDNGVKYAGLFLVTAGSASCIPGILAYSANNVTSHSKRAVSSAVIIAFGGIGGILATTVFREQDQVIGYLPGFWTLLGCQALNLCLLAITTIYFKRKNREARERKIDPIEGRVGFYYTL
jgi:MFS family permease